ncbi:hypothetical protein BJY00DRAFT_294045 [Aspergillus carlsbadensis]|nr:hypothetical protein BJY00DRAFT_294045 [Aspergillus carlsbadensis]
MPLYILIAALLKNQVNWHKESSSYINFFQTSIFSSLETEIDENKQMEDSVWGFDPVIEFDSGNLNDQMEANSSKKRRSALASSKYPAKSAQSPRLPVRCVSSANHSQEPKTSVMRSTDHSNTENNQKEDEYWGFDPMLRSSTNLNTKSVAMEGSYKEPHHCTKASRLGSEQNEKIATHHQTQLVIALGRLCTGMEKVEINDGIN